MTAIPKPARRGPKPTRPIPRRRKGPKKFNPFAAHHALEKLCDDTFALFIRVRGKNRCQLCGANRGTQCAHLISRRYKQSRHLSANAMCLCMACHKRWTEDPLGWDDLMERMLGPVEWAQRKADARVPTRPDYSLMRIPLRLLLLEEIRQRGTTFGLDAQVEALLLRHEQVERKA